MTTTCIAHAIYIYIKVLLQLSSKKNFVRLMEMHQCALTSCPLHDDSVADTVVKPYRNHHMTTTCIAHAYIHPCNIIVSVHVMPVMMQS